MSPGVSAASFSAPAGGISKGGTAEFGGSKSSVGSMDSGSIGSSKSFGGGDQPGMFGKDSPIGSTQSFSEFSPIGKVSGESFEGSMIGVNPFQDTQVIGKASLDSPKAPETPKISALSDTVSFTANLGIINEGPASRSIFSETQAIYEAPKSVSELASPQETQTEEVFEAVLSEEPQALISDQDVDIQTAKTPMIGFETSAEAVDKGINATLGTYFAQSEEFQAIATPEKVVSFMGDLESEDPDAYVELIKDMRVVGEIQRLIQAADIEPELAEQIEQSAVKTAANKAGVIEIAQAMIEAQTEEEKEEDPESDGNGAKSKNGSAESEANYPDSTQREPEEPEDLRHETPLEVKDEPVNSRRAESAYQVIDRVFDKKVPGEMVAGKEITLELDSPASPEHTSGMAQELRIEDGTYYGFLEALEDEEFEATDKLGARARAQTLANEHTGVMRANSGKTVSQRNIDELLSGKTKGTTIFS